MFFEIEVISCFPVSGLCHGMKMLVQVLWLSESLVSAQLDEAGGGKIVHVIMTCTSLLPDCTSICHVGSVRCVVQERVYSWCKDGVEYYLTLQSSHRL